MSTLAPGMAPTRPCRRPSATTRRLARQRVALLSLLVGLEAAAIVMGAGLQLPNAAFGVLLTALGWVTAGRIATWHPASARHPIEEPTRR